MTEPLPAERTPVLCSAWATPADVPEPYRDRLPTLDDWEPYLLRASEILWALSGRRWYGAGCTETAILRAWPPSPGTGSWPYQSTWGRCACWMDRTWDGGVWLPPVYWSGRHVGPRAIRLPRDLATPTVVTVDGAPFTEWESLRAGWLQRTDGGTWDMCGDTTEVTYTFGEPPPEGGVRAAVALAIQFVLADLGDAECTLPERTQSVTRQGISFAVLDPMEFLPNGRTGVYAVDLWLAAVNPHGRSRRGRVWSPDIPAAQRIHTEGPLP